MFDMKEDSLPLLLSAVPSLVFRFWLWGFSISCGRKRDKSLLLQRILGKKKKNTAVLQISPSAGVNPEHCSHSGGDSAILAVLLHTHIDAMEVDTPVGSGPGRNITIAVLAGGWEGGAGGC